MAETRMAGEMLQKVNEPRGGIEPERNGEPVSQEPAPVDRGEPSGQPSDLSDWKKSWMNSKFAA